MEAIFTDAVVKALFALAVGLTACFCGYQLQKLGIALVAFYLGFQLGDTLASRFISHPAAILGCAILCGCVLAGLSFKLYLAGLCIAGVAVAVTLAYRFLENQWVALIAGVAAGLALGFLAIKANRPVVILLTGILGGLGAGSYAVQLLGAIPPAAATVAQLPWLALAVGGVLAVVGVLAQFRASAHAKPTL